MYLEPRQPESVADGAAHLAVEEAARGSYARLLAFLATRTRDIAMAEDALSDAFHVALKTWPKTGVPNRPEAWLLTTARRRLIDRVRRAQLEIESVPLLQAATDQACVFIENEMSFPDERLKLLFICAHPAIDPVARTPLMLQTVLGLDAARIAAAFLVQPGAMSQRLTRAKTKIRVAKISFEIPEPQHVRERLEAVLEAIYAAYGSGWDDVAGADPRRKDLAVEAIELGRVLLQLMPDEPEVMGLLALMLFCEARRGARRSPEGEYIPLSEQDTTRWSQEMISEANTLIHQAERAGGLGRFQLEAAIQHVHVQRMHTGCQNWRGVAWLYEGLVRFSPTVGALVSRAAAFAEAWGPEEGWKRLQEIPLTAASEYQPYWALAAELLRRLGRREEAADAYGRAIALSDQDALTKYLIHRSRDLVRKDTRSA